MKEMELKELIGRYQMAMNTVYRGVNNILKDKINADLTTDLFSTLQYIYNHHRCTSTQIALAFGVGKSAVTAQVNRLYDKGMIERHRDEEDRRNIYLHVTEKGASFVTNTEKELYKVIGVQLAHFDNNEIQSFIRSLEELATIMEAEKK